MATTLVGSLGTVPEMAGALDMAAQVEGALMGVVVAFEALVNGVCASVVVGVLKILNGGAFHAFPSEKPFL